MVNPECKLLLLAHAFDDWGAVRVQLKTDNNNIHSQRAILKLGAKFEGRLRNHRFRADGTLRDTMMYSILLEEWPEVKASLLKRIQGPDQEAFWLVNWAPEKKQVPRVGFSGTPSGALFEPTTVRFL